MGVFLKAKLENVDRAKEILLFLGGKYVETDELSYIYFTVDKDTVTFLRTNSKGETFHFTCTTSGKEFSYVEKVVVTNPEPILAELKKKYGTPTTFVKRKKVYLLKGVEVSFASISGVGTFLELETEQYDYKELTQYIKKFGLVEKDVIGLPYNALVMKATKKRQLSINR